MKGNQSDNASKKPVKKVDPETGKLSTAPEAIPITTYRSRILVDPETGKPSNALNAISYRKFLKGKTVDPKTGKLSTAPEAIPKTSYYYKKIPKVDPKTGKPSTAPEAILYHTYYMQQKVDPETGKSSAADDAISKNAFYGRKRKKPVSSKNKSSLIPQQDSQTSSIPNTTTHFSLDASFEFNASSLDQTPIANIVPNENRTLPSPHLNNRNTFFYKAASTTAHTANINSLTNTASLAPFIQTNITNTPPSYPNLSNLQDTELQNANLLNNLLNACEVVTTTQQNTLAGIHGGMTNNIAARDRQSYSFFSSQNSLLLNANQNTSNENLQAQGKRI